MIVRRWQTFIHRGIFDNEAYPLIAFDGDSMALGLGPGYNMDNVAYAAKRVSCAVGGQTAVTMAANAATTIVPLYDSLRRNTLVVWAGINDLAGGATGADTYAVLAAYCTARKAEGWQIILLTAISNVNDVTGLPGFVTERLTLNALLRSNWATFVDYLLDGTLDSRLGATGAYADTTYFIDGVHLTSVGQAIIMDRMLPMLRELEYA